MSDHFFLFYTVNYVVLGRNGVAIHQHVMTKSGRIFLFLQYQKVTTLKGLGGLQLLSDLVRAPTGWEFDIDEAFRVGQRAANMLKVFNLRHGIMADKDAPSIRYGSTPVDGPYKGVGIAHVWNDMIRKYYEHMGWDIETGKPQPETLEALGLGHIIGDIL